ncbi:unnamed protein product [Darwinula stevensoni]|uniref:Suppressor of white apricot N-terminal domain-containing protein n=1 Tax=Darwinula stevensoni TaxID=69355 RepID=A0A7R8XCE5_9CRUS|nr:unnamed protein product [Darwinula stevensoni]CAG0887448.1 unnamed protein product [Darwinula stevensoni]
MPLATKMWHEARKQEKKIRTMIVDYRKRAERRREFYEKTKQDPTTFLQVHGRPCKLYIDNGSADSSMMPWQGDSEVLIDRFDGRAHLDYIPEHKSSPDVLPPTELEERQANYERYRILVQNEFLGVAEEKYLQQIYLEEKFGVIPKTGEEEKKKQLADKRAAIPYNYDEGPPGPTPKDSTLPSSSSKEQNGDEDDSDLSDIDLDICIDVTQLVTDQCEEMNGQAHNYAARESPTYDPYNAIRSIDRSSHSRSRSRSNSPSQKAGAVTFITSFGGEESDASDAGGPARGPSFSRVKVDSRSRSRSGSRAGKSRSKSKSPSPHTAKLPSPPRRRYYGRKKEEASSSDLSVSEDEGPASKEKPASTSKPVPKVPGPSVSNAGAASKVGSKMTPQERLRRKMQLQLKRQYKADKRAELEKEEKRMQELQDRQEEMREMALRLKKRRKSRSPSRSSSRSRSRSPRFKLVDY